MDKPEPKRFKEVQIGCYKVIRKIACGSFGDIYLAVYPHSGERVAIKVESTKVSQGMSRSNGINIDIGFTLILFLIIINQCIL